MPALTRTRVGIDFFPLTVDYREYTYAGGRIPADYQARRTNERARVLTSRQIDRPIRPLFPEGFRSETQVIAFVLSQTRKNDPMSPESMAPQPRSPLDIPFAGPIGRCASA